MMTIEGTRGRGQRISHYPVPLNAMIAASTSEEIRRLAAAAGWPAAEVVRRALDAGLPLVERNLADGEAGQ